MLISFCFLLFSFVFFCFLLFSFVFFCFLLFSFVFFFKIEEDGKTSIGSVPGPRIHRKPPLAPR